MPPTKARLTKQNKKTNKQKRQSFTGSSEYDYLPEQNSTEVLSLIQDK